MIDQHTQERIQVPNACRKRDREKEEKNEVKRNVALNIIR